MQRVREVFHRVRAGDESVADLFADDGVIVAGGGRIEGRDAIRMFYRDTVAAIHPKPQVQHVLSAEGTDFYVALVDVATDNGVVHALDLFTVDDEGIRRLEIYSRPAD